MNPTPYTFLVLFVVGLASLVMNASSGIQKAAENKTAEELRELIKSGPGQSYACGSIIITLLFNLVIIPWAIYWAWENKAGVDLLPFVMATFVALFILYLVWRSIRGIRAGINMGRAKYTSSPIHRRQLIEETRYKPDRFFWAIYAAQLIPILYLGYLYLVTAGLLPY